MRFTDPRSGAELNTLYGQPVDRKEIYEIDGHNYRSFNEHGSLVQLYRSVENTYYFFRGDKVTKIDAATESPHVLAVGPSLSVARVLGRDCPGIDIETSAGSETHYFDPSGPHVDPASFARHAFGGWNRFLQASNGAIDLKVVTRTKDFVMTMEAIAISEGSFRPQDFEISVAREAGRLRARR